MLDGNRHDARERAVMLVYEADIKEVAATELLDALALPPDPYTDTVVRSFLDVRGVVDSTIETAATGWSLDRMAAVDRAILQVAVTELQTQTEVPTAVIINEAVELAKEYSTEESASFVNGVLSAVATQSRPE